MVKTVRKVPGQRKKAATTKKSLNELEKKIGKVPKFFRELTTNDPEMFDLVMKFENHIWDDGKLTKKTKKADRDCDRCRTPRPARGPAQPWGPRILASPRRKWKRRSASRSSFRVCRRCVRKGPASMK